MSGSTSIVKACTLRQLLASSPPRTFKLARSWAPLLRALRQAKRAGASVQLHDRAALNRALDAPPLPVPELEVRIEALKADLGAVARGDDAGAALTALAMRVDAAVASLLPRVATAPVRLVVEGWPAGFGARERARLLGGAEQALVSPQEAADRVKRLDGRVLGGRALSVKAALAPGEALPRPSGGRQWRWGRVKPWVEVDEEGRWSLTPRHIAEAQAALVRTEEVVDAFCGCGGNAIAFAAAGLAVTTVELDSARLRLARENAARFQVQDAITFVRGDALLEVPRRLSPSTTVFLDPPWGGPGETPTGWDTLLPGLPPLPAPLLIKAPAAFDLSTLPDTHTWTTRYHFGADGADDEHIVKLLTLIGVPT